MHAFTGLGVGKAGIFLPSVSDLVSTPSPVGG